MTSIDYVVLRDKEFVIVSDQVAVRNDIVFWVVVAFFLALVLVICVGFTYLAVNINKNLGSTLLSPAQFYPLQFLQNANFFLNFTVDGYLQLYDQNSKNIYWQSTNENNFSAYGLVAKFDVDGSLSVQNYYDQILWSITPTDNSHPAPFVLRLTKTGQLQVKSVDGSEVICLPDCSPVS